ncbi:MAG: tyrosine protein kinase, partial [Aquabacterium sp.]|nr:tyrosine protein kinase [Aquabacterium sp.]
MAVFPASPAPIAAVGAEDSFSSDSGERSSTSGQAIGDILRVAHNLSMEDIEQILRYQGEKGLRFGEAAVALGLVKEQDVRWAVSKQF